MYIPHGQITQEFLSLRTRNFQGIAFISKNIITKSRRIAEFAKKLKNCT